MIEKIKKMLKKTTKSRINLGVCIHDCEKCKQDSIAHEIKHHFEKEFVENRLLMRWENGKLLVSKKQFNHLLRLCNPVETRNDYDFEFIDEINIGGDRKGII